MGAPVPPSGLVEPRRWSEDGSVRGERRRCGFPGCLPVVSSQAGSVPLTSRSLSGWPSLYVIFFLCSGNRCPPSRVRVRAPEPCGRVCGPLARCPHLRLQSVYQSLPEFSPCERSRWNSDRSIPSVISPTCPLPRVFLLCQVFPSLLWPPVELTAPP